MSAEGVEEVVKHVERMAVADGKSVLNVSDDLNNKLDASSNFSSSHNESEQLTSDRDITEDVETKIHSHKLSTSDLPDDESSSRVNGTTAETDTKDENDHPDHSALRDRLNDQNASSDILVERDAVIQNSESSSLATAGSGSLINHREEGMESESIKSVGPLSSEGSEHTVADKVSLNDSSNTDLQSNRDNVTKNLNQRKEELEVSSQEFNPQSDQHSDDIPAYDDIMARELEQAAEKASEDDWLYILGHDRLRKKILKAGEADTRPVHGQTVVVRCSGTVEGNDNVVIDSHESLTFVLGDGDFIRAFDLAVALMDLGEIAQVFTESRFAYGEMGRAPDVPPNANILYTIELLECQDSPDPSTLPVRERIKLGDAKRERGNELYMRQEYSRAIDLYNRALKLLDDELETHTSDSVEDLQSLVDTRVKCYNNLAAAQIMIEAWDAAVKSCDRVLSTQPENVKALFRKAKCLTNKGEMSLAVAALRKAQRIDPENKVVQQELLRLNKRCKADSERAMYQRMFGTARNQASANTATNNKKNGQVLEESKKCDPSAEFGGMVNGTTADTKDGSKNNHLDHSALTDRLNDQNASSDIVVERDAVIQNSESSSLATEGSGSLINHQEEGFESGSIMSVGHSEGSEHTMADEVSSNDSSNTDLQSNRDNVMKNLNQRKEELEVSSEEFNPQSDQHSDDIPTSADYEAGSSPAAIFLPDNAQPIFLSGETMKMFDLIIEPRVEGQTIDLTMIQADITNRGSESEFYPFKQQLSEYDGNEVLLVFDNQFRYGQNFIIALNEHAKCHLLDWLGESEAEEYETEKNIGPQQPVPEENGQEEEEEEEEEVESSRKCDTCAEINAIISASTFCSVCNQALCIHCTQFHSVLAASKSHAVIEIDKIDKMDTSKKAEELIKSQDENNVETDAGKTASKLKVVHLKKSIRDMARLNNKIYYISDESPCVYVYDIDCGKTVDTVKVPRLGLARCLVTCTHHQCLFVGDYGNNGVHRVRVINKEVFSFTLKPNRKPRGLSLTAIENLLVTCKYKDECSLMEYTSEGQIVRDITLDILIVEPWQTVQVSSDQFIICHGNLNSLHRLCVINSEGQIIKSYGAEKGRGQGQLNQPRSIAVDQSRGLMFVADKNNDRVLKFNMDLEPMGQEKICDKVVQPMSIQICGDTHQMLVSEYSGMVWLIPIQD